MGLGKWDGTRHRPITPYAGSWAHEQATMRLISQLGIDGQHERFTRKAWMHALAYAKDIKHNYWEWVALQEYNLKR